METATQAEIATAQTNGWAKWLPLILLPAIAIAFRNLVPAWLFMWSLSFATFMGLKWVTWFDAKDCIPHSRWRSFEYLTAWPGMDAEAFLDSLRTVAKPPITEWLWALIKTCLGITLMWFVARRIPSQYEVARGWVGLLGLIFLLHFGSFHLISLFWQSRGIDAQPIMNRPLYSRTLSEFWGKRWNLGFRQLSYDLIFHPLHSRIGPRAASLLVFLTSGLIHDLVISLPARGGYGLPTAYFILQGFGVVTERSSFGKKLGLQTTLSGRPFLILVAVTPVFWLFHLPFLHNVILPFMYAIHAL